ncbi:hypothetical protein [Rhizobium sp. NXC14]|uniref:hypothetical protein n=1 Tax=Rhizobium sp. NXC14 TaxID=1981173 RepID=UPI0032AF9355
MDKGKTAHAKYASNQIPAVAAAGSARQISVAGDDSDNYQILPDARPFQMDLKSSFDDDVLYCVFLRVLEEIEAGMATATEASGLSLAELREIPSCSLPARLIRAIAGKEASASAPDGEEHC